MSKSILALAVIAFVIVASPVPANATDGANKQTAGDSKPATAKKEPTKHTVAEGEYLELIGQKYGVEWIRIWQSNPQLQNQDVIDIGDVLIIPEIDAKLDDRPLVQPAPVAPITTVLNGQTAQNSPVPTATRFGSGGPNGYAPGNCTWYVKNKRPDIGGYWGNAGYNWISAAQSAGYATGSKPAAGAIGVQPGHVVYVESVNADGSANISEMNYGALYRMNYRTVPAGTFQYIY